MLLNQEFVIYFSSYVSFLSDVIGILQVDYTEFVLFLMTVFLSLSMEDLMNDLIGVLLPIFDLLNISNLKISSLNKIIRSSK